VQVDVVDQHRALTLSRELPDLLAHMKIAGSRVARRSDYYVWLSLNITVAYEVHAKEQDARFVLRKELRPTVLIRFNVPRIDNHARELRTKVIVE
jgi:hypothetical protein